MVARVRLCWKQIKTHPINLVLIPLFFALLVLAITGGYTFHWAWTGFTGTTESYKTLYDWLQLLIIPAVLAVGGYAINITISRGEQEATRQRDQTERYIELDRQHEATLKEYIDKMSELLLHEHLCDSAEEDEVRKIAYIWTGLALSRLDARRKRHLVDFLRISKLIEANNIVDLRRANLSEVDLLDKNLSGLNFSGAYMREANLVNVDLSKANLSEADLEGADLSGANLTKAKVTSEQLAEAKSLKGATMPDGSIHP